MSSSIPKIITHIVLDRALGVEKIQSFQDQYSREAVPIKELIMLISFAFRVIHRLEVQDPRHLYSSGVQQTLQGLHGVVLGILVRIKL